MGPYSMLNISGTYKGDMLLQLHTVQVFLVLSKNHFLHLLTPTRLPFVDFSSKFIHEYWLDPSATCSSHMWLCSVWILIGCLCIGLMFFLSHVCRNMVVMKRKIFNQVSSFPEDKWKHNF